MNRETWIVMAGVLLVSGGRIAGAAQCEGDAFMKACVALNSKVSNVCPSNAQFTMGPVSESDQRAVVKGWLERAAALDAIQGELDAWKKEYGGCEKRAGCSVGNKGEACRKAPQVYKDAWRAYEDMFGNVQMAQAARLVAQEKTQKKPPTEPGNRLLDAYLREASLMLEVAEKVPALDARTDRLRKNAEELRGARQQVIAIQDERLASATCPAATNPDKKLTAATQAALQKAWANREDKKFVETIKRFGLTGKPFQQRAPLDSTLQEFVNAVACVEQAYPDVTNCRVMNVQLRRLKPDGGSWNDWEVFTTTGGELMACKNLR